MRIATAYLQEFRCFRDATFDLSADITVLYGRNGTGKTALFDAIELALFGSVARLEAFGDTVDSISRLTASSPTRVNLALVDDADLIEIDTSWNRHTRSVDRIGGSRSWTSHRDLLFGLLVDGESLGSRREVTAVRELFRATLMLSQDSIRTFIETDAESRARVFAKLAGLAHIQKSKDKADSVSDLARRQIETADIDLRTRVPLEQDLRARLTESESRLTARRALVREPRPTLTEVRDAILAAGLAFSIPDTLADSQLDPATLRVLAEETLRRIEADMRRLALLQSNAGSHTDRLLRLQALDAELASARPNLAALKAEAVPLRADVDSKQALAVTLREHIDHLAADLQRLERSRAVLIELTALRELEGRTPVPTLLNEYQTATQRVADAVRARADALAQKDAADRRLSSTRAHLYQIEALLQRSLRYETLGSELALAVEHLASLDRRFPAIESTLSQRTDAVDASRRLATSSAEILSHLSANSDERLALLARLRTYATGTNCPLCDTPHSTNAALQQAIERTLSSIPDLLRQAAADEAAARSQLAQQEAALADISRQVGSLRTERAALAARISELQRERQDIETQVAQSSIPSSPADLSEQLRILSQDISSQEGVARDASVALSAAAQALQHSNAAERQAQDNLAEATTQRQRITDKIASLHHQLRSLSTTIEPDTTPHTLQIQIQAAEEARRELAQSLTSAEAELAAASALEQNHQALVTDAELLLSRADEERGRLHGDLEVFRRRWRDFGLQGDPSDEELAAMLSGVRMQAERTSHVVKLAERLELDSDIDMLTTSVRDLEAEHATQEQGLIALRSHLSELTKAKTTAERWAHHLTEHLKLAVARTVERHQLEIERHFKAMIPSPHLFDGVSMTYAGDRLDIGIRYRGHATHAGEPRLFLSNAQLNVLALSMFMSLGSNQGWSRLKMLMLDDPVQHLDDLDAVAFLDTLRAVALGRFGDRRQILVSTCDRNVYRLMVRKFGPIQAAGARFNAISLSEGGLSGPIVRYDVGGPNDRASSQTA